MSLPLIIEGWGVEESGPPTNNCNECSNSLSRDEEWPVPEMGFWFGAREEESREPVLSWRVEATAEPMESFSESLELDAVSESSVAEESSCIEMWSGTGTW